MSLKPLSLRTLSQTPLVILLNPGKRSAFIFVSFAVAILVWSFLVGQGRLSLSSSSLIALGIIAVPVSSKLFDDAKRWGLSATLLSSLVILQGLHTLEHLAQVFQYYVLGWTANQALGLITQANLEWIHFSWNWLVWLGIVLLVLRGLRSPWAWALLVWATLHSAEHTYLVIRYFQVAAELKALGLPLFEAAQSLPGVLGKNGLLALSSLCGSIPGLTTASRAAVHFWWNFGEVTLLLLAAHKGAGKWLFASQNNQVVKSETPSVHLRTSFESRLNQSDPKEKS